MRDSSEDFILRGSWRDDLSTGLGELAGRVEGMEWMGQQHIIEAMQDPQSRETVKELLRSNDPADALSRQAATDAAEAAYPTGKHIVFKSFAAQIAPRLRAAEMVAAQQYVQPDELLLELAESAPDPDKATEQYMEMKVLQAMDPMSISDQMIDEMFGWGDDGLLGKSFFKKIKKVFSKVTKPIAKVAKAVGRIVPAPIRKAIGTVLKVTPIGMAATIAKKQFITAPAKARKALKGAEQEMAAAQAEYDAAYAASVAQTMPTPEQQAVQQQTQQELYNQEYARAVAAAQSQQPQYAPQQSYETPQPGWTSAAPSSGGGEANVTTDSIPQEAAAAAPAAESGGGGGAMAAVVAAGAAAAFMFLGGKKK